MSTPQPPTYPDPVRTAARELDKPRKRMFRKSLLFALLRYAGQMEVELRELRLELAVLKAKEVQR